MSSIDREGDLSAGVFQKLMSIAAEQLRNGNPQKSKVIFRYVYKRAVELDNQIAKQFCALNLGAVYTYLKKPQKAILYLQIALPLVDKREAKCAGDIHYNLALAHNLTGDYTKAAKEFELCISAYKEEGQPRELIAAVIMKAGVLHGQHSRHERALSSFDVASTIYTESKLTPQLIGSLYSKALSCGKVGKQEQVLSLCEQCLTLCKDFEISAYLVNLYNELGLVLSSIGSYQAAAECFEKALQACNTLDRQPLLSAVIMQNLGAIYNRLNRFADALRLCKDAANIFGASQQRQGQAYCFLTMAYSFYQLNRVEPAEECYMHALQAAKDLRLQKEQWQAMEGLGSIYMIFGLVDKALTYFQRAVGIGSALGSSTIDRDRLVAKLTDALRCSMNQTRYSLPPNRQPRQSGQRALLEVSREIIPAIATTPQNVLSSHQLDPEEATPHSHKRAKEPKDMARMHRRHGEGHPIHGFIHTPVAAGLGTYSVTYDQARPRLSPPDGMDGRRRSGSVSSIGSLHILGLAVDDVEGSRGSVRESLHHDEVDGASLVVRPVKHPLLRRESGLLRTVTHSDSDVHRLQQRGKLSRRMSDSSSESEHSAPEPGPSSYKVFERPKSRQNGDKRKLSKKKLSASPTEQPERPLQSVRKSSKFSTKSNNVSPAQGRHRVSLLQSSSTSLDNVDKSGHVVDKSGQHPSRYEMDNDSRPQSLLAQDEQSLSGDNLGETHDQKAVKDKMRELTAVNSEGDLLTESSDHEGEDSENTFPRETEPVYASIATVHATTPLHHAPPILPARNQLSAHRVPAPDDTSVKDKDLSSMTRAQSVERQKAKKNSENVDNNELEDGDDEMWSKPKSRKPSSKLCAIM